MSSQANNEKIISGKILKEKLLIKEDRTIAAYIRDGALPQPVKELEDGELLFNKQEVLKILGVKTFDEEFINAEDASKILDVTKNNVQLYARKGLIPCYRLKSIRGSQILYLRSEVESAKQYTIQWSSGFGNRVGKDRATKIIFEKLLRLLQNIELKLAGMPFSLYWENMTSLSALSVDIFKQRTRATFFTNGLI